jgi:hypothetical protein
VERVELVAPAVAAEVAAVLGALPGIVGDAAAGSAAASGAEAAGGADAIAELAPRHWWHSDVQAQVLRHPEQQQRR